MQNYSLLLSKEIPKHIQIKDKYGNPIKYFPNGQGTLEAIDRFFKNNSYKEKSFFVKLKED